MLKRIVVGNSSVKACIRKWTSSSRNVLQTQLDLEISDNVPSRVTQIVTVITAASLNSVQIYRILERTVPCPLRLFYFCFI
jgi:hypothetical protein